MESLTNLNNGEDEMHETMSGNSRCFFQTISTLTAERDCI